MDQTDAASFGLFSLVKAVPWAPSAPSIAPRGWRKENSQLCFMAMGPNPRNCSWEMGFPEGPVKHTRKLCCLLCSQLHGHCLACGFPLASLCTQPLAGSQVPSTQPCRCLVSVTLLISLLLC